MSHYEALGESVWAEIKTRKMCW